VDLQNESLHDPLVSFGVPTKNKGKQKASVVDTPDAEDITIGVDMDMNGF